MMAELSLSQARVLVWPELCKLGWGLGMCRSRPEDPGLAVTEEHGSDSVRFSS